MTLEQYTTEAARTCPSLGLLSRDILHMNMGITTEIGEIVDTFKKKIAYGKEIDRINLAEEIGDVMWYVANKARLTTLELNNKPYTPIKFYDEENIAATLLTIDVKFDSCPRIIEILKGICVFYSLDFEKCLETNIKKLYVRYPEKFTQEQALNRDLETERKILEGDETIS